MHTWSLQYTVGDIFTKEKRDMEHVLLAGSWILGHDHDTRYVQNRTQTTVIEGVESSLLVHMVPFQNRPVHDRPRSS